MTSKTSNKGGECSHSKNPKGKNTVKNLVPSPVSIPMCAVCALGCIQKVWSVVTDMTGLSVPVADGYMRSVRKLVRWMQMEKKDFAHLVSALSLYCKTIVTIIINEPTF